MIIPKPGLCIKIVEHLQKENPLLIEDAAKQVEKIEPHFHFFFLIYPILSYFCAKRRIQPSQIKGVHLSRQMVYERTLFIAVVLRLYSPSIFRTNVSYNVEDGLRRELFGLLQCNKEWISQQVDGIARNYNRNYQEFKDQVNDLLMFIKSEVKEVVVEEEVKQEVELFQ